MSWDKANRARKTAVARLWLQRNLEKERVRRAAYARAWRARNRKHLKTYRAELWKKGAAKRAENIDAIRAKDREKTRRWRLRHPDAGRSHYLRTTTPESRAAVNHKRRAKLRGAEGSFTSVEWRGKRRSQHGICAYCGKKRGPLTMDHDIPLARGGSNWITNLVGACGPCNGSKGSRTGDEFRRARGFDLPRPTRLKKRED